MTKLLAKYALTGAPGAGSNFALGAVGNPRFALGPEYIGKNLMVNAVEGSAWEVRTGCIYSQSANTITRGTLSSSSTGSAITFTSAATVEVFSDLESVNGVDIVQNAPTTLTPSQLAATQALVSGDTIVADRAFSGTANDANAYLNALFVTASALSASSGRRQRVIVPSGIWRIQTLWIQPNVWYDFGDAIFRKFGTGLAPNDRMLSTAFPRVVYSGPTYYGGADDIKITGGMFENTGVACSAGIVVLDECRRLDVDSLAVRHNAAVAQWAIQVSGRGCTLRNCRVLDGSVLFQDGIHIKYGDSISVVGGYVESGDDAIALGWDISGVGQTYDDEALTNVTVSGVAVRSEKGSAVKVYYGVDVPAIGGTNRRRVRNALVTGITGKAAITRNNAIAIKDGASVFTDRSVIEDVTIEAVLDVGSTTHDGNNPFGVWLNSGKNINIKANLNFTDTTGGATRFRAFSLDNCEAVTLSLKQRGFVDLPSVIQPAAASQTLQDITLQNFDLLACETTVNDAIQIYNATGSTGRCNFLNGVIRNIRDGKTGIYTATLGSIESVNVQGVAFIKRAGSTTDRAFTASTVGICQNLTFIGNDVTQVSGFAPSTFAANCVAYNIHDNKGMSTRKSGTTTIGAASTAVTVTHSASIPFPDTTSALGMITVTPTNFTTNPTKWNLSVAATTTFAVTVDGVPGASTATFAWSVDTGKKPI